MDFTCDGCGKYHWIPSEDKTKREVIENLETLLDWFRVEPWQITWLEYHEPELMNKFYDAIKEMVTK